MNDKMPDNVYLWVEVWNNIFNIEHNHYYYGFEPTNLRTALTQIINDIDVGIKLDKSISKIVKYLREKFDYAVSVDFISRDIYSLEIKKYREILNCGFTKNNNYYENDLIVFSNNILQKYDDGSYFNKVYDELYKTIFSTDNASIKILQALSNFLIIELINKGFSIATIKDIPFNLFDINISKYLEEKNKGKYYRTNLDYPFNESTSFEERFSFIKSLFNAPIFECDILMLVLGVKGGIKEKILIDDVEFINKLESEFSEGKEDNEKLFVFNFQEEEHENAPFVRARIRKKGRELFNIMEEAFEVVLKTVEFLKYRYTSSDRKNIRLSKAWAAIDLNGEIISQMPDYSDGFGRIPERFEANDSLTYYNNAIQITKEQGRIFGLNYNTLESNKIHVALEWLNKAEKTLYSYDIYFMNLWIALEYLIKEENLSIIESLQKCLPALLTNSFLKDILHNLHKIHSKQIFIKRMTINDINLAKNIGLYPIHDNTYKWHHINYGKSLSLISHWTNDNYVRKISDEVVLWFTNSDEFISTLKNIFNRNIYDFNMMYKIRNNIVHNANANNDYLSYYCLRLDETINLILEVVMHELQYNGKKRISDILSMQKIQYELNLEKIKRGNYSIN